MTYKDLTEEVREIKQMSDAEFCEYIFTLGCEAAEYEFKGNHERSSEKTDFANYIITLRTSQEN